MSASIGDRIGSTTDVRDNPMVTDSDISTMIIVGIYSNTVGCVNHLTYYSKKF